MYVIQTKNKTIVCRFKAQAAEILNVTPMTLWRNEKKPTKYKVTKFNHKEPLILDIWK